jgi:hypothetical protein
MNEDRANEFGIHRLIYPLMGLDVVLDTRRTTMTFEVGRNNQASSDSSPQVASSDQKKIFSVRLDKFRSFEEDLRMVEVRDPSSNILPRSLKRMADNQEPIKKVWRDALDRFTFLLARYSNKHNGRYQSGVRDLVRWMGVHGPNSAWRIFYDGSLSFEHRYDLLKTAQHSLSQSDTREQGEKVALDAPEQKERQLLWWTTLCKYDFAQQWCERETYRDPAAQHALRESAVNYLQVLKDEARQRDLRRFLTECGTDLEREVRRVLFPKLNGQRPARTLFSRVRARPKPSARKFSQRLKDRLKRIFGANGDRSLAKDEVIRRTFFVWFLKRYAWWSAVRLILSDSKKKRMFLAACAFSLFIIIAGALYMIQIGEFPRLTTVLPSYLSPEQNTPVLWSIQVLLQLASLVSVLAIAPLLFRLLMPRALFGSLLAWCTVIFTALRDVHELKMNEEGPAPWQVWKLCHTCSDTQALKYSLLISLGIIILDSIFIAYAVTQFTDGFRSTAVRTLSTLAGLLAGSLFWGLIFALPIKVAVERDVFRFDDSCVIPIVLIGASIAVLFGLMVELIWQDQSLAEPLGEPL